MNVALLYYARMYAVHAYRDAQVGLGCRVLMSALGAGPAPGSSQDAGAVGGQPLGEGDKDNKFVTGGDNVLMTR